MARGYADRQEEPNFPSAPRFCTTTPAEASLGGHPRHQTREDLIVPTLHEIYDAEHRITKALRKMNARRTHPELKQRFAIHLRQTEGPIQRLAKVFQMHGPSPKAVTCPAISGLIEKAGAEDGEIVDTRLCGTLSSWPRPRPWSTTRSPATALLPSRAKRPGREECVSALQQNLNAKKATDHLLAARAERQVGPRAAGVRPGGARRALR